MAAMLRRSFAAHSDVAKAVAIGLAIGLAFSTGVVVSRWSNADTSDWMSFAGAVLGAGLTVAGGVALFEWQRHRESRERRDLLLEALRETILLTHGFHSADEPALRARTGRSVRQQTDELRSSIDRLQSVREWMKPDTARMLRAFDDIRKMDAPYAELKDGLRWVHVGGADLGGLNATGHEIATLANSAIHNLGGQQLTP